MTGLVGGERISKSDIRLRAYGSVDEFNAILGCVRSVCLDPDLNKILLMLQHQCFRVGSDLATPKHHSSGVERISKHDVETLEHLIDEWNERLPALHAFILPGGNRVGSLLHLARTVARRAERWTSALLSRDPHVAVVLQYLNRLSDLLFVLARSANAREKIMDVEWDKTS